MKFYDSMKMKTVIILFISTSFVFPVAEKISNDYQENI